jgi:hypothetical protein
MPRQLLSRHRFINRERESEITRKELDESNPKRIEIY